MRYINEGVSVISKKKRRLRANTVAVIGQFVKPCVGAINGAVGEEGQALSLVSVVGQIKCFDLYIHANSKTHMPRLRNDPNGNYLALFVRQHFCADRASTPDNYDLIGCARESNEVRLLRSVEIYSRNLRTLLIEGYFFKYIMRGATKKLLDSIFILFLKRPYRDFKDYINWSKILGSKSFNKKIHSLSRK